MKKEKISIKPDKSLYPKLGQTGYSVSEAISEFVDNSIDARKEEGSVKIDINIDLKNKRIVIEDDGSGMNRSEAIQSIRLASSQKKDKLGQFGLGLKTAAMSLGKKFTIETKKEKEKYILIFDEDEFLEKGDWDDFDIYTKAVGKEDYSGTRITIENLKTSIYTPTIEKTKKQLQDRFSPFLTNKEVFIKINGETLIANRPAIVQGTKKDHLIKLSNGDEIKMWTAILKKGSQTNSGFNLYRRGRLIRANEKLGYSYHPSKMWIVGEVNLDTIPVTHNKREFITTDPLYIEFLEKFSNLIKPILKDAQQRHREKKIEDLTQEVKETLKDNLLKAINDVDDFQELAFPSTGKPAKRSDESGELFEKEKRAPRERVVEITEEKEEKKKEKGRTPKKTQNKKKRFIVIAGKKYQFDYEWQEIEEDVPKVGYIDKERKKIMIILNSRFSVLNIISRDNSFYIGLYVAEGIVEEVLKENSQSLERVISLRDRVIKKLADIVSEDIEKKDYEKKTRADDAKLFLLKNKLKKKEIRGISKKEEEILCLRLGANSKRHTLQEIAKNFNVTKERIRQIEGRAISKIVKNKED